MSHKLKKKKPYEVRTGQTVCPKCERKQAYTLYTCLMPHYDEIHDKTVSYIYAYGKCNKCGEMIHTNKMRKLNNKALKAVTKVPYDWKAHAERKKYKQEFEKRLTIIQQFYLESTKLCQRVKQLSLFQKRKKS